jgi:hypothetical protein
MPLLGLSEERGEPDIFSANVARRLRTEHLGKEPGDE